MLKCKEITDLASDYIDKNLDWKNRFSMKMHLFLCKHCSRFMQNFKTTIQVASNIEQQPLSPEEAKSVIDDSIKPQK